MYTNQELSAMARNLKTLLADKGLALSHSQTLELLARAQGDRNLHVTQAREREQTPVAGIDANPSGSQAVFATELADWRIASGDDLPDAHRTPYRVSVKHQGPQVFIDVISAHKRDIDDSHPELSIGIEINDGLPCLHIGNDVHGDTLLTLYGTRSGLFAAYDDSTLGSPPRLAELAGAQDKFEGTPTAFISSGQPD